MDKHRPSNERSLPLALKASLDNAFVGRCFAFEFRGLKIPHSDGSSVSLSAVLKQSRLGSNAGSQPSLVASRIRQLGTSADITVLSGIRKYLQQLEFPRNEPSTQGSSLYSSPQGGLSTNSESDTSSLVYQSVEQDDSCCIALQSFQDTVTSSASILPSTASPGTPQTGHSNLGTSSPCVHESREESIVPSISGFLNESSFAFLGTWDTKQATSPSCSCVRSCGGCTEESPYSDLEATELLHELFADWESTQRQQTHMNPSTEKEFSPSTLSAGFLTSFLGSFREDATTPSPAHLYASRPADVHSASRATFVGTPLFSTRLIAPGVDRYSKETPELFSSERNTRTPYSLPVVSRLEGSSTSPELFGSSQPPRHPVLQVVDSSMSVRPSVTPAINRSLSAVPRRNILQEITNTDQLSGVPAQCAQRSTDGVATTPFQTPLDRVNLFSSPDLFSP